MLKHSLPKDAVNGAHPDALDGAFYRSTPVPNAAARPAPPQPLNIVFGNIPDELKQLDQWVLSRPTWNETKWDKPPLKTNGQNASSTSPATWTALDKAKTAIDSGKFPYLGFVVTQQAGIVAVDLDGCIELDTDTESADIEDAAGEIIARFNSYTEISPSGHGVRIFVRGRLPCNGRKAQAPWKKGGEKAEIEIGGNAKYFTVTGKHAAGTPLTIEEGQSAIDWLFSEYFDKPKPEAAPQSEYSRPTLDFTDTEIVERARNAKNGGKFSALYDSATGGNDSEEDAALCCHLAFWTRDAGQIERIFNSSARGAREKWQERPDYRERTITAALETVTEYYTPPREKTTGTPTSETPTVFEFGFTTDNDLDDRLGEIEWEWPGYIPRGFVTAIVGDQDVGKSQVAQSLCDIRLRGNRWPDGQPHEPRPDTKLLWIDTEGSIALFHQRMKLWGMKRGCFILPPDPLQELTVDDELHWMWIEAAIEKFMPPFVVIDALSGAHKSGKENGNDEMKPVMKKLAGLAQKYNIAVLVVHHLNKPIAGVAPYPITIHRLRGASAIPQYCRSILALGSPDVNQPEKRRMDVIKLNLAKKPAPVGYELSDHGPLWGDAPEPPKERRAIDDALDFLEIALKDGPRLSEDVQEEAKAQKIGSNALRDAMKAMKVKPRREGGKNGRWFWYPITEAGKDGQE
jgi:hypothetical protein